MSSKTETGIDKTYRYLRRAEFESAKRTFDAFSSRRQADWRKDRDQRIREAKKLRKDRVADIGIKAYEIEYQKAWATKSQAERENRPPDFHQELADALFEIGWTLDEFYYELRSRYASGGFVP